MNSPEFSENLLNLYPLVCFLQILEKNNYSETGYSRLVHIPKEASEMAVKKNGSFAAVVVFPGVRQVKSSEVHLTLCHSDNFKGAIWKSWPPVKFILIISGNC